MFLLLLLMSLNAHAAVAVFDDQDVKDTAALLSLPVFFLWDKKNNQECKFDRSVVREALQDKSKRGSHDPFFLALKGYSDQDPDTFMQCLQEIERDVSKKQTAPWCFGSVVESNYLVLREDENGWLTVTNFVTLIAESEERVNIVLPENDDDMFVVRNPCCEHDAFGPSPQDAPRRLPYDFCVYRTVKMKNPLSSYAVQSEKKHHCKFMRDDVIKKFSTAYLLNWKNFPRHILRIGQSFFS
ncbi:MAG: hypothetical protein OXC30_02010 [Alphaproteobacteria bacterium]|nr:hypothetical protein [Alphaproteobacteria bacterium]